MLNRFVMTMFLIAPLIFSGFSSAVPDHARVPISAVCVQPPTGLIGWWTGDNNARDIVGGKTGTLENGTAFAPGKVGTAFTFDGVDDSLLALDVNVDTPQLTYEAWVYSNGFQSYRWNDIVTAGNSLDEGISRNMIVRTNDSYLEVYNTTLQSAEPLNTGQWYHLAYTNNSTLGRLYVNGNMVSELEVTLTHPSSKLTIGNWPGFSEFWNGRINEVSIYNRALTDTEIQSIYSADSLGKCKTEQRANILIYLPLEQK